MSPKGRQNSKLKVLDTVVELNVIVSSLSLETIEALDTVNDPSFERPSSRELNVIRCFSTQISMSNTPVACAANSDGDGGILGGGGASGA
jgi:hypothetical protein